MTSIRSRLAIAVVGCTTGAVLVAAIAAGVTARAMLLRSLDERLQARLRFPWILPRAPSSEHEGANGAAAPNPSTAVQPSATQPGPSPGATPGQQWSNAWPMAEVHDAADGVELFRSPSLAASDSLAAHGFKPGEPIATIRLADGRPARLLVAETEGVRWSGRWRGERGDRGERDGEERDRGAERRKIHVYLAVDASDVFDELGRLGWILAAVWCGATALSWAVVLRLRRRVLEPVESLTRTIRDLSPSNLSARVPTEEAPVELQAVVERLNDLLARVEAAFRRERATIANLAHELRNPLTALRAKLEFGLLQECDRQHVAIEAGVQLTQRMQSMINGLLTLTRIEAGQETPAVRRADVVALLRDAAATVDARARARGMRIEWRVPERFELDTSPNHLALVFGNLLDNAVSHGAPEGTIEVELTPTDGGVRLTLANPFAGAPAPERAGAERSTFEPLWRRDPARTGDDHCGLGLALCDRVVRLLGGRLAARQDAGRFEITIELPPLAAAPVSG